MKTLASFLLAASVVVAQPADNKNDYASEASRIVATYRPANRDHSPEAMAAAANKFLSSLDEPHRQRVAHELKSPERRAWTNVPPSPDAGGLRLGDCSADQIRAFCDLLACLLSDQGYTKMRNIMLADDQLIRNEQSRSRFGTESFSVVLFGTPSSTEPWAFQLDGHHVGVNLAIHGEQLTMSPSFFGTQPEAFRIAGKTYRPLVGEIDIAFKLVNNLSDEQRHTAIVSEMRGNISTGPGNDARVPDPQGVSCATFEETQKQIVLSLIGQWIKDLPPKQAGQRMKQIEEELDKTYFAWKGPREPVSDVSYVIQGPSLIIEYACQDLGGNPLDHLHTMYRDPTNEYGKQLEAP